MDDRHDDSNDPATHGQVELTALNSAGDRVLHARYSWYEWYEGIHPIVDSADERARLGVRRIEGVQFDLDGTEAVRWRVDYTNSGELAEAWEWRPGVPVRHTVFGGR